MLSRNLFKKMPRKRKLPSDSDVELEAAIDDMKCLCLLVNAERVVKKSVHFLKPSDMHDYKRHKSRYYKELQKTSKCRFRKWKADPGTMPLGAASFVLRQCREDQDIAKIAHRIGLHDLVTTVTSIHDHTTCPKTCTLDTHQEHQQQVEPAAATGDDNDNDEDSNHHDYDEPFDAEVFSHHEVDTIDTSCIVPHAAIVDPDNNDVEQLIRQGSSGIIIDEPDPKGTIVDKLVKKGVFTKEQVHFIISFSLSFSLGLFFHSRF